MSTALILLRDWQASQVEFWMPLIAELYDISSFGRIRSLRKTVSPKGTGTFKSVRRSEPLIRKLGVYARSDGYVRFSINKMGKKARTLIVHREVAKAFIPNPNNLPEVNHINGIKADNRQHSLERSTRSHNIQHSFDIGLRNNFMLVRRKDHEYLQARIKELEQQLAEERAANRDSERHFADMILRKAGSYPQPKKLQVPTTPSELEPAADVPGMDQGAIDATIAAGLEMGVSRQETIRLLKQQAT